VQPSDPRPRQAIEQIRAWTRGEIRMSASRAGGLAIDAARELSGPARHAAYAAGQAAEVAHVAAHELGAAACAIKAARAAAPGCEQRAGRLECRWQREQLPMRSATSSLTISGCETISAGRSSTADGRDGLVWTSQLHKTSGLAQVRLTRRVFSSVSATRLDATTCDEGALPQRVANRRGAD
jgi:hypothetical protein